MHGVKRCWLCRSPRRQTIGCDLMFCLSSSGSFRRRHCCGRITFGMQCFFFQFRCWLVWWSILRMCPLWKDDLRHDVGVWNVVLNQLRTWLLRWVGVVWVYCLFCETFYKRHRVILEKKILKKLWSTENLFFFFDWLLFPGGKNRNKSGKIKCHVMHGKASWTYLDRHT